MVVKIRAISRGIIVPSRDEAVVQLSSVESKDRSVDHRRWTEMIFHPRGKQSYRGVQQPLDRVSKPDPIGIIWPRRAKGQLLWRDDSSRGRIVAGITPSRLHYFTLPREGEGTWARDEAKSAILFQWRLEKVVKEMIEWLDLNQQFRSSISAVTQVPRRLSPLSVCK